MHQPFGNTNTNSKPNFTKSLGPLPLPLLQVHQPFDESKFNFTKALQKEVRMGSNVDGFLVGRGGRGWISHDPNPTPPASQPLQNPHSDCMPAGLP